ncbi:MAG: PAS domain S-box protein [Thainema sp.]
MHHTCHQADQTADSPEYIRLLIEHTPAAIAMLDRELRYLATSRRWLEDYGLGDQAIIGRYHYDIFPEIPEKWKQVHQRCLAGAVERCEEETFERQDGRVDWVRWEVRPWYDLNGDVGGIIMSNEVITARKQAELALQEANENLEATITARTAELQQTIAQLEWEIQQREQAEKERDRFFKLSADMLCVAGFDGYFKRLNPKFEVVLDYSTEELMAEPVLSFVHPDDQDTTVAISSQLAEGKQVVAFENRYRCKNGSYRWFSWTAASDVEAGLIYASARDITESKQAREDLYLSQQRYASLAAAAPVGIFRTDSTGRCIYINQRLSEIAGLLFSEALDWGWTETIHEADRDRVAAQWQQAVETHQPFQAEYRMRRHDGSVSWVYGQAVAEQDSNGAVVGYIGTITDISDRKLAEAALQDSETRYRQLYTNTPVMMHALNCEGEIIHVSDLWLSELGYEHHEVIGRQLTDFLTAESRDYALRIGLPSLQQAGSCRDVHYRIVKKNGDVIDVLLSAISEQNEAGQRTQSLAVLVDVTEQKQAEAQLQNQACREQLFNQLTNRIRDSLDFEQILGVTVQEIHAYLQIDRCHFAWYIEDGGAACWDITSEVQAEGLPSFVGRHPVEAFGALSDLLLSQETLRLDDVTHCPYPEVSHVLQALGNKSMLVLPVCANSGQFGIIACIHSQAVRPWIDDEVEFLEAIVGQLAIALNQAELYTQMSNKAAELEQAMAELQRTQTQMVQAEKMSSLGQLVAGVAHEINNPVNFIYGNLAHAYEYTHDLLGLVQLYQEQYPAPVPVIVDEMEAIDLDFLVEDLPKLMSSMKVGTERIRAIVASLRTFSRMDEAEMKAVNIHDGIDSTLMILHNRIKAKCDRAEIQVVQNYGELPLVECYAGQLNQVFMNLISNAIDALDDALDRNLLTEQPSLTITTEQVGSDHVAIRFADNGIGIPTAVLSQIFNPFFTTKPIGKGTGMGLSISYQIVTEKHGGSLDCYSEPGSGTEFVIQIPIYQPGA